MHEIELKVRVDRPEKTERLLRKVARFSSHYTKNDQYWTIGKKTIRIRQEQTADKETVLVTQKIKKYAGLMETNQELEFELSIAALPVFIAMLKNTGFSCTAKKQKDTKSFIPHMELFTTDILVDVKSLCIELSAIAPIGVFLECEALYPDEKDAVTEQLHIHNAQTIFNTLLSALDIPLSAIEMRPYNELLASFMQAENRLR